MSGTLRLRGSTSGYSELQAPAAAADQTFVLPTAGGTLIATNSPAAKLILELGSASQPTLTFQGDTDTGLFSEGTNTLNLVTGGSSKVVLGTAAHTIYAGTGATVRAIDIDSSGNVGIGTSTGDAKLTVNSSGARAFEIENAGSSDSKTLTINQGNANNGATTTVLDVGASSGNSILTTGNVGVGTSSPLAALHIGGATNGIRFGISGATPKADVKYTASGLEFLDLSVQGTTSGYGNIRFFTGPTPDERMRIDSSGRLLVGTSSTSLSNKFLLQGDTSGANNGGYMRLQTANSVLAGTSLGSIGFGDTGHNGALIEARGDVAWNPFGKGSRLEFSTTASGATSPTERMRIDSSGRLLIGTTTEGVGDASDLTIENPLRAGLTLRSASTEFGTIAFSDATSGIGEYDGVIAYEHVNQAMRFSTASTEAMRIDSSGRLLVGTSSARTNYSNTSAYGPLLNLEGTSNSSRVLSFIHNDSSGGPFIVLGSTGGSSAGSNNLVAAQSTLGFLSWQGADGSGLVEAASIKTQVDGTPGADDMPGRLVFSTTADGASSPTERMRISSNGLTTCTFISSENYVIVGTEQGGTTVNAAIDRATNGNGTNAVFIGTSQIQVTSDIRLKHNIANTELNATEKIKQIEIFDFDWNDPRDNEWKNCRGRWTGFSAQQVQPILPFCINAPRDEETREILEDDPSDWVVDPTGFIPVLVKALQEANAKIETLEQRLSDAGIA